MGLSNYGQNQARNKVLFFTRGELTNACTGYIICSLSFKFLILKLSVFLKDAKCLDVCIVEVLMYLLLSEIMSCITRTQHFWPLWSFPS